MNLFASQNHITGLQTKAPPFHQRRMMFLPLLGERAGVRASLQLTPPERGLTNRKLSFRQRPVLQFVFLVLAIALYSPILHAADTVSSFDAANKLYEQGKYADAVAAYDQLLKSGDTAAVYYNRGNALFKLNQLGRAIASYRQAQSLAPRDPDLRANLQSARTRTRGGTPYHAERWRVWLEQLTLNEWTLLTALAVWLLFLVLALAQWRPELKTKLAKYVTSVGVAALLFGLCLGIQLNAGYFTRSAIVIAGEAEVRNGPLDEAPPVYKVRDGLELNILDEKDNWLQVRDPALRVGWVRRDQVLVFEPDGPAKAKS